jgi:diguanylate cyclase (GGDEF)-like protein
MDASKPISVGSKKPIPLGNVPIVAVGFALYIALLLAFLGTEHTNRALATVGLAFLSACVVVGVAAIVRRQEDGTVWVGLGLATLLQAGASLSIALGLYFNAAKSDIWTISLASSLCGSLGFSLLLVRQGSQFRRPHVWTLILLDLAVMTTVSALTLTVPLQIIGKAPNATNSQFGLAIGTEASGGLALGLILISVASSIRENQATRWLITGWIFSILVDWEFGIEISKREIDESQIFLVCLSASFAFVLAAIFRLAVRQPVTPLATSTSRPIKAGFASEFGQLLLGVAALSFVGIFALMDTTEGSNEVSFASGLAIVGLIAAVCRLTLASYFQHEEVEVLRIREAELERQALSDSVTDLPNHRLLVARLAEEVERAHRFKQPLSVCFVDVDAFKQINDTHGHQVGDEVLREIGSMLRANARQIDIVARYGGEEFVILLPGTWSDDALIFAERLREAIAITTLRVQQDIEVRLSVSVGVAGLPEHANDRDSLLKRADDAAYVAKRSGRNQVHLYNPELKAASEQKFSLEDAKRIVRIVEERERLSVGHGERVGNLSAMIAQQLGLDSSEVERIALSGRFHDLGKVSVPDSILGKNGQLSSRELQLVRSHPFIGARLVESSPSLVLLASALRHHHERWDGSGYPYRLAGEYIPLAARIIAITEAYDAMTRETPWREPLNQHEALNELTAYAGKQFDPKLVELFARIVENSPSVN